MDSRFFIDADTPPLVLPSQPIRRALRAGLLAPLAGLIAAVALFVTTLSVVAESQEEHAVATRIPAQTRAAPSPQVPSEPFLLANARGR